MLFTSARRPAASAQQWPWCHAPLPCEVTVVLEPTFKQPHLHKPHHEFERAKNCAPLSCGMTVLRCHVSVDRRHKNQGFDGVTVFENLKVYFVLAP